VRYGRLLPTFVSAPSIPPVINSKLVTPVAKAPLRRKLLSNGNLKDAVFMSSSTMAVTPIPPSPHAVLSFVNGMTALKIGK
jgi:hypothetical protein